MMLPSRVQKLADPVAAGVIERVTKGLSHALDDDDPLPGSYTLEVTTPGLDRPLQTGRDFRRQRGHEVQVVREGSSVQGTVLGADDQQVTLEVDGRPLRVPLSDV